MLHGPSHCARSKDQYRRKGGVVALCYTSQDHHYFLTITYDMLHGPSTVNSIVLLLTKLNYKIGGFQLLREHLEGHFPISKAIDFESCDC